MIRYLREIETDQPYYILDENGDKKIICLTDNWADEFVIDHGRGDKEEIRFRAKKEFKNKLENIVKNEDVLPWCFIW